MIHLVEFEKRVKTPAEAAGTSLPGVEPGNATKTRSFLLRLLARLTADHGIT